MGFDAFRIVDELATVLDPDTWMLVGGLMVHAHAQLAGLQSNRPTYDADIVVEVEVQPTGRYRVAAAALERIGFRHQEPVVLETPSYRFERGSTEVIDLMATDRTPASRFAGRPVLQVPASASAAKHTEPVTTPGGTTIRVPTLPGALALKGAACATTSHPRIRHFQDGVVLLACADVRGMTALSKSQRRYFNDLVTGLQHPEAWSLADAPTTARAVRMLRKLRQDWAPPAFLQSCPRR